MGLGLGVYGMGGNINMEGFEAFCSVAIALRFSLVMSCFTSDTSVILSVLTALRLLREINYLWIICSVMAFKNFAAY